MDHLRDLQGLKHTLLVTPLSYVRLKFSSFAEMGSFYEVCTNSTTLALATGCIFTFLAYDYWKKLYFVRNGIPGPVPLPLIGSLFSISKGFTDDFVAKQKKYGKVYGIHLMNHVLVIEDLDMLQEIFISKFSSFPNRAPEIMEDAPLNKAVTMARDGHWRDVRGTLTPAFTGSKMKKMSAIINESCDQMIQSFDSQKGQPGGIQLKDVFGAYSMDVIASVFFGLKVNSQNNPNDPFVKNAKKAFNFSLFDPLSFMIVFVPGFAKLWDMLGGSLISSSVKKFFLDVVTQALNARSKEEKVRADILQLMINAHELDTKTADEKEEGDGLVNQGTSQTGSSSQKSPLTREEIMANAMLFFLAGYETTNTSLCYVGYLLATNPSHQETLREEVDHWAPTREDLTYEVLSKMEYLDCFVKETLRMYPPVAVTERLNDQADVMIRGLHIPKGFQIFAPIYVIHHDPEIWEDPEEFKPERFNKENRGKIHPVSWLPFGDGPRSCLGMRLAMMEIKFAVVRLLQEFRVETCPETEIPIVLNQSTAMTSPPNGVKVQVTQRKKTE